MTARYSTVAIVLHWLIALAIIAAVLIAEISEDWEGAARGTAMMLHKSLGLSILALSVARILWRLTHRPSTLDPHMKGWERAMAHAIHITFYVLMIALPLSGWAMSSAAIEPKPISYLGLFDIPFLPVQGNIAVGKAAHDGHEIMGKIMIAAFFLHVAGALKHSVIDKRPSLSRMGLGRARD